LGNRFCLGGSCVAVSVEGADARCLGLGLFEFSLAAGCLARAIRAKGVAEALRNLVNDLYALCGTIYGYVADAHEGFYILHPKDCNITAAGRVDGSFSVETSCGLRGSCRLVSAGDGGEKAQD